MLLNQSIRLVIWMNRLCKFNVRFFQGSAATYSGELVDLLIPSLSALHLRMPQWKNINIGPYLQELWGIIMHAQFFWDTV